MQGYHSPERRSTTCSAANSVTSVSVCQVPRIQLLCKIQNQIFHILGQCLVPISLWSLLWNCAPGYLLLT